MDVEQVILNARDEHPAFTRRSTPDAPLLRFLTRLQQRLLSEISHWKKDAVQEVYEVDLPLVEFDDGEELPAHLLVHGGTVYFNHASRDPEELHVVQFADRLRRYRFRWGAYVQVSTLKLLGREQDWSTVDRLEVFYFPEGPELTARDSEFILPGQPLNCLTAAVADFLASRTEGVDVQEYAARAGASEEAYLDQVTGRRRATVSKVREVW